MVNTVNVSNLLKKSKTFSFHWNANSYCNYCVCDTSFLRGEYKWRYTYALESAIAGILARIVFAYISASLFLWIPFSHL